MLFYRGYGQDATYQRTNTKKLSDVQNGEEFLVAVERELGRAVE